jgi:hypothetical protein
MRRAGASVLTWLLVQSGEVLRPVEDERAHLVVAPCAPVRLLEAAPENHVIPKLYRDPKRTAAHLAAHAAEDGDLVVGIIVVVVRHRLAEQAGDGRKISSGGNPL